MALWLDLIPKIHRSDNLDERFHLLDHFDDLDSFDAAGVDLSRLDQLRRTYATSTTTPPRVNSTTATVAPRPAGNAVARSRPPPSPLPSRPRPTSSTARPTTSAPRSTATRLLRSLFYRGRDGSVPLGVTVAVGCGLLFLNVLVFAAIFYQREKATRDVREWRRRRRTETGDDDDRLTYIIRRRAVTVSRSDRPRYQHFDLDLGTSLEDLISASVSISRTNVRTLSRYQKFDLDDLEATISVSTGLEASVFVFMARSRCRGFGLGADLGLEGSVSFNVTESSTSIMFFQILSGTTTTTRRTSISTTRATASARRRAAPAPAPAPETRTATVHYRWRCARPRSAPARTSWTTRTCIGLDSSRSPPRRGPTTSISRRCPAAVDAAVRAAAAPTHWRRTSGTPRRRYSKTQVVPYSGWETVATVVIVVAVARMIALW